MMEEVESCVVDGWRRSFDEKEFVSYRIILKFKESEKTQICEKRYSEFLSFHAEIKDAFDENSRMRLIETFPSKQFLSLQTDNFAERRSRALDAYLQILLYALRTSNSTTKLMKSVKQFFNMSDEHKQIKVETLKTGDRKIVRTPNYINYEIERLRKLLSVNESMNESEFKELQKEVYNLQEKREKSEDDLRCVEKFYELKREWEIRKIRSGTFDGGEFDLNKKIEKKTELTKHTTLSNNLRNVPLMKDEMNLQNIKRHLFEQDAMLTDLSETLTKQKLLSKEICSEVIEQNRLLGRVGEKQEIVAGGFKGSNDRVKKLQDK